MTCRGLRDILDDNTSGDWFLVYQGNRIFWRPAILGCCILCTLLIEENAEELERINVKVHGKVRTINA